jgi:hypothetical protein
MKKVILVLAFLLPSLAFAGSVTGTITKTVMHMDEWKSTNTEQLAYFHIHIDGLPKACNQKKGYARVVIPSNHPSYNTVVDSVLFAQENNKKVNLIYLDSCSYRENSWDFAILNILTPSS